MYAVPYLLIAILMVILLGREFYPVVAVVRHISHRVLVMYLGHVIELAPRRALHEQPMHPYTRALLAAIPIPDPERERSKQVQILHGDLPSPLHPPSGCVFCTRCPLAKARCADAVPPLRAVNAKTQAACVLL